MDTLKKKPLVKKKVFQREFRSGQSQPVFEVVKNEFVRSKSDLKNVTNLFKDNADFITYGISRMTFPF